MSKRLLAIGVSALALGFASSALADSNSAYVDQVSGNTATNTQTGVQNTVARPAPNAFKQGTGNTLTTTQTGDKNRIANAGGSQANSDVATFTQDNTGTPGTRLGNEISYYYSGSRPGPVGNNATVTQTGDNNLVSQIFQDHNRNTVDIQQIGNSNGRWSASFGPTQSGNYRPAQLFGQTGNPGIPNNGHGSNSVATIGQDGSSSSTPGNSFILHATGDSNSFNFSQTGTGNTVVNPQTGNGNYIGGSQYGTDNSIANSQSGNYNVLLASQNNHGLSGGGNVIGWEQSAGNSNMAEMIQTGAGNQVNGWQRGSSNLLLSSQNGTSNILIAQSTGSNDTVNSQQIGLANRLEAYQTVGSNNSVVSTQGGMIGQNIAVFNQAGSNNSVTNHQN
jgi:hypothetical protein